MQQTLIGQSSAILTLQDEVSRLAPINRPLLILGERGTGKEMTAERIHFLSARWEQPFIKINCAAFTEQLLDSELFGHEVGAFTGANKLHRGLFERANHGTLFLDELATLSVNAQEKILRMIEYGEFQRVGGHKTLTSDVRIVAATNGDILQKANEGSFRADLLDRLAFDVLNIPPLRERGEDITLLAEHFAVKMTRELGRDVFAGFTQHAIDTLYQHTWPGNIRELRNAIERSIARCQDWQQAIDHIRINPFVYSNNDTPQEKKNSTIEEALEKANNSYPINFDELIEEQSKVVLINALKDHRNHQKQTAKALNISYDRMRYLVKKWGINKSTYS